jgi:hypothetical protein
MRLFLFPGKPSIPRLGVKLTCHNSRKITLCLWPSDIGLGHTSISAPEVAWGQVANAGPSLGWARARRPPATPLPPSCLGARERRRPGSVPSCPASESRPAPPRFARSRLTAQRGPSASCQPPASRPPARTPLPQNSLSLVQLAGLRSSDRPRPSGFLQKQATVLRRREEALGRQKLGLFALEAGGPGFAGSWAASAPG